MKKLLSILLLTVSSIAFADTPSPQAVKIKGGTDGTSIGNTGDALKVVGSFSPSGTTTVVQPTGTNLHTVVDSVAGPVAVTGTFFQSTQPVSGTFFQATQPVSVAGPVAVTGTFFQSTQPVSLASMPLPSGAATAAKQDTGNTSLASIDSKLTSPLTVNSTLQTGANTIGKVDQGTGGASAWKVDGSAVTQPISAVSLPLPTSAATSANQTTANSSLSSIDGKITAVNTGAVVVSSSALPSGASTSSLQTTGNSSLSSIDGKITAVNTGAVVVSSSALPSGAATSANQTSANSSLSSIDTKLTSPLTVNSPVNTTGSGSAAGATVSTVATITAPANAVGFVLMNMDSSTTNMRWAVGRTATTTLGQQLQPGRDSGFIPIGADVSVVAESGTVTYDIQWVSR